jgi:hypothetical protein
VVCRLSRAGSVGTAGCVRGFLVPNHTVPIDPSHRARPTPGGARAGSCPPYPSRGLSGLIGVRRNREAHRLSRPPSGSLAVPEDASAEDSRVALQHPAIGVARFSAGRPFGAGPRRSRAKVWLVRPSGRSGCPSPPTGHGPKPAGGVDPGEPWPALPTNPGPDNRLTSPYRGKASEPLRLARSRAGRKEERRRGNTRGEPDLGVPHTQRQAVRPLCARRSRVRDGDDGVEPLTRIPDGESGRGGNGREGGPRPPNSRSGTETNETRCS